MKYFFAIVITFSVVVLLTAQSVLAGCEKLDGIYAVNTTAIFIHQDQCKKVSFYYDDQPVFSRPSTKWSNEYTADGVERLMTIKTEYSSEPMYIKASFNP